MARSVNSRLVLIAGFSVIIAAGVCGPAFAQRLSPDAYADALHVYVDGLREQRAAVLACGSDVPADEASEWERASAILVASFWANGSSGDLTTTTRRLMAEPWPDAADCSDGITAYRGQVLRDRGWVDEVTGMLTNLGATVIATPPTDAQWQEIRALFAREAPLEAGLLECMSVVYPLLLPGEFKLWNDILVATGEMMVASGLPRDEVVALITAADPNALWDRTPAADRLAVRDACAADELWIDRPALFQQFTLKSGVEDILKPTETTP